MSDRILSRMPPEKPEIRPMLITEDRGEDGSQNRYTQNRARTVNDPRPDIPLEIVRAHKVCAARGGKLRPGVLVKRVEWGKRRIIKAASRISYHGRRWWVHVASAFPLRHYYQAVFGLS